LGAFVFWSSLDFLGAALRSSFEELIGQVFWAVCGGFGISTRRLLFIFKLGGVWRRL
jgi:hypothetical protein